MHDRAQLEGVGLWGPFEARVGEGHKEGEAVRHEPTL